MRPQTKMMLDLLTERTSVNDNQATRAGIINPRREAALIERYTDHEVVIKKQSDWKRKYQLKEKI